MSGLPILASVDLDIVTLVLHEREAGDGGVCVCACVRLRGRHIIGIFQSSCV